MSKFDYGIFSGGFDVFAASKEKYTKEEVIKLYKNEIMVRGGHFTVAITGNAWVRHRAGRNEDNEIERYSKHITNNYEYIKVE